MCTNKLIECKKCTEIVKSTIMNQIGCKSWGVLLGSHWKSSPKIFRIEGFATLSMVSTMWRCLLGTALSEQRLEMPNTIQLDNPHYLIVVEVRA